MPWHVASPTRATGAVALQEPPSAPHQIIPGMEIVSVDIKQFLEVLWGDDHLQHFLCIWTPAGKISNYFNDIELAAKHCQHLAANNQDAYMGVSLAPEQYGPNRRLQAQYAAGIPGLWLDIDYQDEAHSKANLPENQEAALELLKELPVEPSIIIHSGHGLQAWWLFQEPWIFDTDAERQQAADLAKAWNSTAQYLAAKHMWTVDSTHDLARVMRVAGTKNCKNPDDIKPVRILGISERRYDPDHLESLCIAGNHSVQLDPQAGMLEVTLRADASPDAVKLNQFGEEFPTFKKTWNRKRRFKDDSLSSYDMALVNYGVQFQWTDQEIADLLIAFRRKHDRGTGQDAAKALRASYITQTITKARKDSRKFQGNGQGQGGIHGQDAPGQRSQDTGPEENPPFMTTKVDLLARAKTAGEDDIQQILRDIISLGLSASESDAIVKALKTATGTSITAIRADLKSAQRNIADTELQEQHFAAAQQVVTLIGKENIIFHNDSFWLWTGSYWKMVDDRVIRLHVHSVLQEKLITDNTIKSIVALVKDMTFLQDHAFDVDTSFINAKNGELRFNGDVFELRPHVREHYRTSVLATEYDPNAIAPRFERFLNEVFAGDFDAKDKKQLVLEAIGYTCCIDTTLEKFFVLYGEHGANGKTRLMNALSSLLGEENRCSVSLQQFDNKFQMASLHGKLANLLIETEQSEKFPSAKIKTIVSGEPMTAEHKFKAPFTFRPTCTLWFATNHLPKNGDSTNAFKRRATVIEFNNNFDNDGEPARMLDASLASESAGILNMALTAFSDVLNNNRFTQPASCQAALQRWCGGEPDHVQQFLEEMCVSTPDGWVSSADMYDAYQHWASVAEAKSMLSQYGLSMRLKSLGFTPSRQGASGTRGVRGLRLMEAPQVVKPRNDAGFPDTSHYVKSIH